MKDRRAFVGKFDIHPRKWDKQLVKAEKNIVEKKTPGTLTVEKHRTRMNKLTSVERQQLCQRAAELMQQS